jgi:uncharacterized delta-60 repeat protein
VLPDGVTFSTVTGEFSTTGLAGSSTGALDTPFGNGLAGAANSLVDLAVHSDGKIVIGGYFTAVNGVARTRIARLNTDGTLDTSFGNAGVNTTVQTLGIQSDGKVVIGGGFTSVNGAARGRIARLNVDGTIDTTFGNGLAGADAALIDLAVQPDGKVVIGGDFTAVNGVARTRIARLNADGSLDTSFGNGLVGADAMVQTLAVQSDGKIVIGGIFTNVNGVARTRIARLNGDGTLDTSFGNGLAGANNRIEAIVFQPDGKIVIGGDFTTVNGTSRGRFARLNGDGTLDTSFGNGLAAANGSVQALTLQPDGKIVVAGGFTTVNGTARGNIARLNTDGTLDGSFGNGLAGASYGEALAHQPDGKIVIGGTFTTVNGVPRGRIARLDNATAPFASTPITVTVTSGALSETTTFSLTPA